MKERHDKLAQIRNREFDLVVIGGGINGAGVAQLGAASGLKVLLLEKNDFAAASSGNTNKLLHGYFPYLQQVQLNINKQEFAGRECLRRVAPHLVQDVSFVLPLARNNLFFNMKAAMGNTLYETLRMSARKQSHSFLSKKKLANLVPALAVSHVLGGIQFSDTTVDDARLVIAVLKAAEDKGAIPLNYVQVTGFVSENGRVSGVKCRDRYAGQEFNLKCKVCINASGNFKKELLCNLPSAADAAQIAAEYKFVRSINLIVSASAFETNAGLILPGDNGDFAFVFPWQHSLLVGIGGHQASAENARTFASDKEEIESLLKRVNEFSKAEKLNISDVKSYFHSDNPIIEEAGNISSTSAEVVESQPGLFTISGGVLGEYQQTAEQVLQKLLAAFPDIEIADSPEELLLGGWADSESYIAESSFIEIKAKRLGLDPSVIEHLVSSYGAESSHIVDLIEQQASLGHRIISDYPIVEAEIPFAVISEMAVSVQDFMLRRSRLGVLNPQKSMEVASKVAETMAKLLNWDRQRLQAELKAFEAEIIWLGQEANVASR